MATSKGPPNFRDAGTGKFVTERFANQHQKTTEKEHNRPPPASPPKQKGK